MSIVVTGAPKVIEFKCYKCGTTFLASYPSWSNTKKGYSCSCPTCPYTAYKKK